MIYFISSFPFLLAFEVGGLGFEFCVFVAGWRHALRSERPFNIIIIIITALQHYSGRSPDFHPPAICELLHRCIVAPPAPGARTAVVGVPACSARPGQQHAGGPWDPLSWAGGRPCSMHAWLHEACGLVAGR